jgi:hypothetical protein
MRDYSKQVIPVEQVRCSRAVHELLSKNPDFEDFVQISLTRHFAGDWGNVGDGDRLANDLALLDHSRLFSAYCYSEELRICVITDADWENTTVLFSGDY